jgi:hypothetical protein
VFAAVKICSSSRLFGAAKPSKPFSVTPSENIYLIETTAPSSTLTHPPQITRDIVLLKYEFITP